MIFVGGCENTRPEPANVVTEIRSSRVVQCNHIRGAGELCNLVRLLSRLKSRNAFGALAGSRCVVHVYIFLCCGSFRLSGVLVLDDPAHTRLWDETNAQACMDNLPHILRGRYRTDLHCRGRDVRGVRACGHPESAFGSMPPDWPVIGNGLLLIGVMFVGALGGAAYVVMAALITLPVFTAIA